MKKKRILIILITIQITFSISSLTKDANEYCLKDSLKSPNLSEFQRKDLYDRRYNNLYSDYKEIINFLKNPLNNSKDFFGVVNWELVLLLIFICVVFICFFIFVIACCFCKGKENNVRICTVLGCFGFWVFMVLFITALVFFSISDDLVKDFLCSIFKIPSGAIDGINDTENKFIGLSNLKNTFTSLKSELPNLTNVLNNLNSITKKNTESLSNEVWIKSLEFYNTHKNSEIIDAVGVYSKPKSVLILQKGINTEITSELTKLDTTADKLNKAALEGKNLIQNFVKIDETLTKFISRLSPIINAIEETGDFITNNFKSTTKYSKYIYFCMIGFCILSIILFIFLYVIIFNMCRDKCWYFLKCGKALVIILSLLLFIYLILIFNMMIGITSFSGFCGFVHKFRENNKITLDEFPEINSDVRKFVEICMAENATGDLESFFNTNIDESIQFKQINVLLDGFSSYRQWKNYTTTATTSKAIEDQKLKWDQNELAYYTDFKNVNEKLEELNKIVSCSNEKYVLTKDYCGEEINNCKIIYYSGNIRPPITVASCVEDKSGAKLIYENLQKYQNEEIGLMNEFQAMVSEVTNPESVQYKYKLAKDSLLTSDYDVSKVEDIMIGSFKFTREMNSNWIGLDDCRSLRVVLLQFEEIGCFRVNYYFYIYFVVNCVCACLFFFLLWCACLAFRSPGSEELEHNEESVNGIRLPREEDIYVEEIQIRDEPINIVREPVKEPEHNYPRHIHIFD